MGDEGWNAFVKECLGAHCDGYSVLDARDGRVWGTSPDFGPRTYTATLTNDAGEDVATLTDLDQNIDRINCLASGGQWRNPSSGSFDDVWSACLLLFEMSSLEGWPTVMYAGIDAAPVVDQSPALNRSPLAALYFVLWVLAGGMVLVNLFVGVLVETFSEEKGKTDGNAMKLMDDSQQQWAATFELMLQVGPKRVPPCPASEWRAWCWRQCVGENAPKLDTFILLVIVFNTVLMGMDGYGISESVATTLRILNFVCTLIFVVEAAIKIAAHEIEGYFADGWNIFDFIVVAISLVDLLSIVLLRDTAHGGVQPTLLRILRIARILRTMRAIKSSRGLRMLLTTLLTSIPALANVLALFFLIQFTYAVLGMHLFRHVQWTEANAGW